MEDLILLVFLLGLTAAGYLLGNLFPIEVIRGLLGLPRSTPDLRALLREVIGAPAEAEDAALLGAVLGLREEAERGRARAVGGGGA